MDDNNGIIKVCPPESELCNVVSQVVCSEIGCKRMFTSSSNLNMHLLKHHKVSGQFQLGKKSECVQYYCPVEECYYNMKQSCHHFTKMKYLKQHYLKIHAEKNFDCSKCLKKFSTSAARNYHSKNCGIEFVCSCNSVYNTHGAFFMHSKRTGHTLKNNSDFLIGRSTSSVPIIIYNPPKPVLLQMKPNSAPISVPVHLVAAAALSELGERCKSTLEVGIQTEDNRRARKPMTKSYYERSGKKGTSSTQTHISQSKKVKISIETQTGENYIPRIVKNKSITPRKKRKSMETQTISEINSGKKTKMNNIKRNSTSFTTVNDFSRSELTMEDSSCVLRSEGRNRDPWIGQKSSSTQTNSFCKKLLFHNGFLTNSDTQTDLNIDLFAVYSSQDEMRNVESSSCQTMKCLNSYLEENSNSYENDSSFGRLSDSKGIVTFSETVSNQSCLTDDLFSSCDKNLVFDENRLCSIASQTEVDISNSLLTDESYILCSTIETQTNEEEDTEFDSLLYSNMHTQTNDILSDLGFSDIETQTAWTNLDDDGMFVSAETQTAFSAGSQWFNSNDFIGKTD